MAYHEEEQLKIKRLNTKQAIALAMQGNWKEAVEINKSIIEMFPDDVDAFNRLGRAHMETGNYTESRKAYEHSLSLDPYNSIAKKNLQRLSLLRDGAVATIQPAHKVEPKFIEEAGKSGVFNLQRLASSNVLVRMDTGERVILKVDENNLLVKSTTGEYIGQVEPRHAQRLIRLMEGGNKYSASIISCSENKAVIIIREIFQHPDLVGQPSFPPRWAESLHSRDTDKDTGTRWEEEEDTDEASIIIDDDRDNLPEDYSPTDEIDRNE